MIEFAAAPYSPALVQEMMPLWKKHHDEIHQIPNSELDPHIEMYETLAVGGVLRIYTARDNGQLVGYQVFTVTQHPHFRKMVQAVMDILYLSQESRLGWMGYRFLQFVDDQLTKEGATLVFRSISVRHDFGPVLERMGYGLTDLTFMRQL